MRLLAGSVALVCMLAPIMGASTRAGDAPTFEVVATKIDDLKSVYATVRSRDLIYARVRTPGTVQSLKVDEGSAVQEGQVLALVTDPKISLKVKATDARIVAATSRRDTAKVELDRANALFAQRVSPQSRVDQAQMAYDVAVNDLKAAEAERAVAETEIEEGEVLAPTAGRVLKVPVTEGSVVLAGESIATIAAGGYLLRLELPERYARFMKVGDAVRLGARGLSQSDRPKTEGEETARPVTEGRVVQVYPELVNGRVIADAEVADLGAYFVGERVLIWISAGKRETFVVPRSYVFRRFGITHVRLARNDGGSADAVVQTGRAVEDPDGRQSIEILSGVAAGDRLVQP